MIKLLKTNVSLKEYSSYKIGGIADYFLDFSSLDELERGLLEWQQIAKEKSLNAKKIFILGRGNNILFSDQGYRGLILHNSINFITPLKDGLIEVGSGTSIDQLNDYCINNSLSGLEWSGGLPGTLGGAIFGNAGAFGGEMKDNIEQVKSYNLKSYQMVTRDNKECLFGYRQSIFKTKKLDELIVSAKIPLRSGDKAMISKEIEQKIEYRETHQPLEYPSLGSTFKNVPVVSAPKETVALCSSEIKNDPFPVIPAAFLIHLSGFTGTKIGGAEISTKHPNFIVNVGDAKAEDIKALILLIQRTIKERFGVEMETEIRELT